MIIVLTGTLAVGYVWQNIEVVKLRMEYERLTNEEIRLAMKNNALRYEIERHRRMPLMEKWASSHGWKKAGPKDLEVLVIRRNDK